MPGKLSPRQEAMIEFIESFIDDNGYPPTIREIGRACNISSTSVVNYNLNKLEREGLLVRDREVSRGLRLHDSLIDPNVVAVPLLGRIVAGEPLPAFAEGYASDEHILLTKDIVTARDELFALQVYGDSMIDAMINDGDIVILKPDMKPNNGDMVAAWLLDREETTLKYFYNEGSKIRLQPANPTMSPIFIEPDKLQIQGRVVAVVRQIA